MPKLRPAFFGRIFQLRNLLRLRCGLTHWRLRLEGGLPSHAYDAAMVAN